MRSLKSYRILFIVFLGIDVQARGTASRHSLISVFSREKFVLFLAEMDTLEDLWTD